VLIFFEDAGLFQSGEEGGGLRGGDAGIGEEFLCGGKEAAVIGAVFSLRGLSCGLNENLSDGEKLIVGDGLRRDVGELPERLRRRLPVLRARDV